MARAKLSPEERSASAKRGVETRRANASAKGGHIKTERAKAAASVNVIKSAERGTIGRDLKKFSPAQLADIAKKHGVVADPSASTSALRKQIATAAYSGVAQHRQLSGQGSGAPSRAAAMLGKTKAVAAAVEAAAPAAAPAGKVGLLKKAGTFVATAAQEVATGYVTGGKIGAAKAVAQQVGKGGKVGVAAAILGYTGYEGYQGYQKDGTKGAAFGVADGVFNAANLILPGALSLPENVASKIAGYDYGEKAKADKAATAKGDKKPDDKTPQKDDDEEEEKKPAANSLAPAADFKIPSLANGFNPFSSGKPPPEKPKATWVRDADGSLGAMPLGLGGMATMLGGTALGSAGQKIYDAGRATGGAQGFAKKLAGAATISGGKAAYMVGGVAATVGLMKAVSNAVGPPPKPKGLFGAIESGGKIATDLKAREEQKQADIAVQKQIYAKTGKMHTAKEIARFEKGDGRPSKSTMRSMAA